MRTGNIPQNLIVVVKRISCRPAFITDANKPKDLEGARNWANHWGWHNGQYYEKTSYDEFSLPNISQTGYKIVGHENRPSGTCFKCITPEGWLVDIRDDVVCDTIMNAEIDKGMMKCLFIWGKLGSQMRLFRVGSDLYNEVISYQESRK